MNGPKEKSHWESYNNLQIVEEINLEKEVTFFPLGQLLGNRKRRPSIKLSNYKTDSLQS